MTTSTTSNDETRVLSCMQPTGDVHLGNYLGALQNWVLGQHDSDAFHGIVDLHALTVVEEPGVIVAAVYAGHRVAREMDAPDAGDVSFRRERVTV